MTLEIEMTSLLVTCDLRCLCLILW